MNPIALSPQITNLKGLIGLLSFESEDYSFVHCYTYNNYLSTEYIFLIEVNLNMFMRLLNTVARTTTTSQLFMVTVHAIF